MIKTLIYFAICYAFGRAVARFSVSQGVRLMFWHALVVASLFAIGTALLML